MRLRIAALTHSVDFVEKLIHPVVHFFKTFFHPIE
jgi:hypothetical protein